MAVVWQLYCLQSGTAFLVCSSLDSIGVSTRTRVSKIRIHHQHTWGRLWTAVFCCWQNCMLFCCILQYVANYALLPEHMNQQARLYCCLETQDCNHSATLLLNYINYYPDCCIRTTKKFTLIKCQDWSPFVAMLTCNFYAFLGKVLTFKLCLGKGQALFETLLWQLSYNN